MDEIEKLANKVYPLSSSLSGTNMNMNIFKQTGFIEGYKRAQGSVLTWKDIIKIIEIENTLWCEQAEAEEKLTDQQYAEEILKRFKEQRNK